MTVNNVFLLVVIILFSTLGITKATAEEQCKDLLTTICNDCHNSDRICSNLGGTEKKWQKIINWMISNGAELNNEQQTLLVSCLSEPYDEAKKFCSK